MGKRNRKRRMSERKTRRMSATKHMPGRSTPPDRAEILEILVIALSSAASMPAPWHAAELLERYRGLERELDVAADLVVHEAIRAAWEHGWSPTDLHEVARRRATAAAVRYLDEAIVGESRRYAAATLHPRWRAQLADIGAAVGPAHSSPQMWRWAAANSASALTAVTTVLQVLNLLARIPVIQAMLPVPGSYQQRSTAVCEVDEKMLARVRGLLAKAEATEYPDEAEALSAKAQALMFRYSLSEAVAAHDRGQATVAGARRMWIDNPYVAAKVALVQAVATANRCRTVWLKGLGCVVTVGVDTDLDVVDLLATSLLVQASRAMLDAGRRHEVQGQSRVKSFRLSFLAAYATRIGERLTATSSSVTDELRSDERLLPVLAARNRAADDAFTRMFPSTVASPLMTYDAVGTRAGRSAADTAILDVRDAIAG